MVIYRIMIFIIIRPFGTVVPGGLVFYYRCSFFFHRDISEFPPLIDVKLCHVIASMFNFITRVPKFGGLHQKKSGPKTCKIRVDCGHLQNLMANISGTDRDIQNQKTNVSTAISPASGEKVR